MFFLRDFCLRQWKSRLKLQEQGCLIKCVAPTGKAAKRMEEATGEHASTIHRLINAIGDFGSIDADVVIVDEFSMVDVYVMYMLTSHLDKDRQEREILRKGKFV